jgi:hypothetical protein
MEGWGGWSSHGDGCQLKRRLDGPGDGDSDHATWPRRLSRVRWWDAGDAVEQAMYSVV